MIYGRYQSPNEYRSRSAHSMLRTVRLVIISLAVVGVAFGLYQLGVEPIETETATAEIPGIHDAFLQTPMNEKGDDHGGVLIDGVKVTGGEKSKITFLDDSMRKRIHLQHNGWRQADETGRRFHLIGPKITFYLAKGQKAEVRADEGDIISRAKDQLEPQEGTLRGNVRIVFDRTTDKWRTDHPEEKDLPTPQNRLVRVWLGEMDFDLDLGKLNSQGPVRIESEEMLLQGKGLSVRWSETTGRIESLRIEQGQRLVFSGGAGLDVNLATGIKEDSSQPIDRQADTTITSASPSEDDMEPPRPSPARDDSAFTESDDVIIIRLGEAESDQPERFNTYIAEFASSIVATQIAGQAKEGRLAAGHLQVLFDMAAGFSKEQGTQTSPDAGEQTPTAQAQEDTSSKQKVHLTWTGPLTITAEDYEDRTGKERRLQLIATGKPVILENQDGRVTCATFVHHMQSEFTEFHGDVGIPAVIESGSKSRLVSREIITLDKKNRLVKLRGDVLVEHEGFSLTGRKVDAFFEKPEKTSEGRSLPDLLKELKCYGDIVALQDTRQISARRTMFVTFRGLPRDAEGRVLRNSPSMKNLEAEGEVTVVDEVRGWDIKGERLACAFDQERVITSGYIEAVEGQQAHVQVGQLFIEGRSVEFDEKREWAHVPGAGVANFVLAEDLDGRRSDEPVPVRVTWQEEMTLRGQDNILIFEGNVVAKSRNNTLRCSDSLRITLADEGPEPLAEIQLASRDPMGMWFLGPYQAEVEKLNKFLGNEPRKPSPLAERFKKRARYILADGNASLESRNEQKSTGTLESRLTLTAPQIAFDLDSRVLMIEHAGALVIEDYPNMSELARRRGTPDAIRRTRTRPSGLFANVQAEGPSQTSISWDLGMHYYYDERVAEFESKFEPVHMTHRSGSHIVALEAVAFETGVDINQLYELTQSGSGRKADLTCRTLFAVFGKSAQDTSRGTGNMSIGQLREIYSHGDVLLTEEGKYRVRGERLVFIEDSELIEVYGSAEERAFMTDVNPKTGRGVDLECRRISIELETWQANGQDCLGRSTSR